MEALNSGSKGLKNLMKAVSDTQSDYTRLALQATQDRRTAAKTLDKAMARELAPLKMERAVFFTEFTAADPGPDGAA